MKGCVECLNKGRFFLEGTVFGETDIVMNNRYRLDSYRARGDCYLLKLDKNDFLHILDVFEDIRVEIQKMVLARERKRIEEFMKQKQKSNVQMEYNELSSLVNGFDFNAIRQERNSRIISAVN